MSRYKNEVVKTTIEEALSTFFSEIEGLAEEVREVVDNAPEGLQDSPRISTMSESADTLESIQDPGFPEALMVLVGEEGSTEIQVSIQMRGGKKRGSESRSVRRDNACSHGRAAVDELRAIVGLDEESYEDGGDKASASEDEKSAHDDARGEIVAFCDDLEGLLDEAEGAEFPGMMG